MKSDDLKAYRAARKMSKRHMAEWLGVSPNTIARWESGETEIPVMLERLIDLERAYEDLHRGILGSLDKITVRRLRLRNGDEE